MVTSDQTPPYEPGMKYLFHRDETELKRFADVHAVVTPSAYGGRLIYDKNVKIERNSKVLDAGAGTGVWLMSLAKEVPESASLYGIDIYGENFPKSPPPNVHFSVCSVSKLPEEWSDTFDFVNERILGVGLIHQEWSLAIPELYRVTRPGGSIQLCEHISEAKNLGPAWARGLALIDEIMEKRGLDLHCALKLPGLLKDAGFVDVVPEKRYYPLGQAGGEVGKRAAEAIDEGLHNLLHTIKEENMDHTKKEIEELLADSRKEWDGPECVEGVVWIISAKKPA